MKYYIIAGEASGDLHGSNLIKELKKLDENAAMRCWGGDKMQAAGATLVKHYKDLAFMGFSEVLKNLPTIFKNLSYCKRDILQYQPDVVILIDYPGFNLRIAKWAKINGFKVIFYISPQVWAWKESRVKQIKKYVDKMLVILPFEKEFYKKWNYNVEYVGHPLVEVITDFQQENINNTLIAIGNFQPAVGNLNPGACIIALLPGSRKQELKVKLPVMLKLTKHFPEHHFYVAKAPGITNEFYNSFFKDHINVGTVTDQTYVLLMQAKAALVTSGTATLETALFGVPEIVCYKGNALSYQLAKRLIKIKFISLVNLIMNKEVVKELIQDALTVENLKKELSSILNEDTKIQQIKNDYAELKKILQQGGNASLNAAVSIYKFIKS
ncbi:MAG: lipid-A-disaccharide synthase [Ginsengibacter sp.]